MSLSPSKTGFRFGGGNQRSLRKLKTLDPPPQESFICRDIDVGQADILLLIGLDFLDEHRLVVNTVDKVLEKRRITTKITSFMSWKAPFQRSLGHIFYSWGREDVCFTQAELVK